MLNVAGGGVSSQLTFNFYVPMSNTNYFAIMIYSTNTQSVSSTTQTGTGNKTTTSCKFLSSGGVSYDFCVEGY